MNVEDYPEIPETVRSDVEDYSRSEGFPEWVGYGLLLLSGRVTDGRETYTSWLRERIGHLDSSERSGTIREHLDLF